MEAHNSGPTPGNPLATILLGISQFIYSTLLSVRFDLDLTDFRVWSLWSMSISSGVVMFIINRKQLKKAIREWREEFKRKC